MKRFFIACRPWAFAVPLAPIILLGISTFKGRYGNVNLDCYSYLLFTLSIICVHACANLINSVCDYSLGIDVKKSAGDRTLVDGFVSKRELYGMVGALGSVALTCFYFVNKSLSDSAAFSLVCITGSTLAVVYSFGRPPLKHVALGDVVIFVCFGPLLVAAASVVLLGKLSPKHVLDGSILALPCTLLTVAILNANNIRDQKSDREAGVRTVANSISIASARLYQLVFIAGSIVSGLAVAHLKNTPGHYFVVLTIPVASKYIGHFAPKLDASKPQAALSLPRDIDEQTAQLLVVTSVCLCAGNLLFASKFS